MKLHHIGIVTRDVEKAINHHGKFMTGLRSDPVKDKIQGAKVGFIGNIEFVQPLSEGSLTSAFARKGGGLHHLCFEVEDIEKTLGEGWGILIKGPDPAVAFNGRKIAWIFTEDRLLVEFLEAE